MKFNDYIYVRPNLEAVKEQYKEIINKINNGDLNEVILAINDCNKLRNDIDTNFTLVSIRYSINTADKFYEEEQDYMDSNMPYFTELANDFFRTIVNHKFRYELEKEFGTYWFEKLEVALKTFDPIIIDDIIQENKVQTSYNKLIASAKIDFEGKIYNLSQMRPFSESLDRETRKNAQKAIEKFFLEKEEQIDTIYDTLIHLRTNMAKKLGYDNYVDFGYARLGRTDYTSVDVAKYRKQIEEDLVPLCQKLIKKQAKRLKIDDLKYYDLTLDFLSGNPTPKGDKDYLLNHAKKMYSEMSKETKEFFDYMIEHELLDLETKPNKQSGGYCTFIYNYKSPFIFSNFNGTSGDVDVLTHEAGHAFQVFQTRNFAINELIWPTYEACEIHSMSMEFFAEPWLEGFFKEDTEKYRFCHINDALLFIPYGATIDEFQHFVYENPDITPNERKAKYREIEKKYLPHKDYCDNDWLNRGGYWFRQGHVFDSPFYYIDYTLAQICAFQYYIKMLQDPKKTWDNYISLCKLGGSKPFLGLINAVGLDNPFVEGTIRKITTEIEKILNTIDDSKF